MLRVFHPAFERIPDLIAGASSDECVNWPWGKNSAGYGIVWNKGKSLHAHRVAYQMAGRSLNHGEVLRHDCDNPACINPLHLRPGSQADNVADGVARGRSAVGERNGGAKLNWDKVAEIRASGARTADLAARYAISRESVNNILSGRTWRVAK